MTTTGNENTFNLHFHSLSPISTLSLISCTNSMFEQANRIMFRIITIWLSKCGTHFHKMKIFYLDDLCVARWNRGKRQHTYALARINFESDTLTVRLSVHMIVRIETNIRVEWAIARAKEIECACAMSTAEHNRPQPHKRLASLTSHSLSVLSVKKRKFTNLCTFRMIIRFFFLTFSNGSGYATAIIPHFRTYNWFSIWSWDISHEIFYEISQSATESNVRLPRLQQECCGK